MIKVRSEVYAAFIIFTWGVIICDAPAYPQGSGGLSPRIVEAEEHYLRGKGLLDDGEYESANESFKKAQYLLDKDEPSVREIVAQPEPQPLEPKEPVVEAPVAPAAPEEGILQQASRAYREGKIYKAIALYQQALEDYPSNYNIHYNLGVIYFKQGHYEKAVKLLFCRRLRLRCG